MVQLPSKVKEIIETYIKSLKQHNIPIKEAILFGSYAKGDFHDWSDIDIALVSEIFVGNRIDDKDKIRSITLSVSSQLEIIPFSPQDFNSQDPFVKEILRTGLKVA